MDPDEHGVNVTATHSLAGPGCLHGLFCLLDRRKRADVRQPEG